MQLQEQNNKNKIKIIVLLNHQMSNIQVRNNNEEE